MQRHGPEYLVTRSTKLFFFNLVDIVLYLNGLNLGFLGVKIPDLNCIVPMVKKKNTASITELIP